MTNTIKHAIVIFHEHEETTKFACRRWSDGTQSRPCPANGYPSGQPAGGGADCLIRGQSRTRGARAVVVAHANQVNRFEGVAVETSVAIASMSVQDASALAAGIKSVFAVLRSAAQARQPILERAMPVVLMLKGVSAIKVMILFYKATQMERRLL